MKFTRTLLLLAAGMSLATAADLTRENCASLQGLSFPASAIGLPNTGGTVETAIFVGADEKGNANGEFCKVTGVVKPRHAGSPNLEFEVNLPVGWNRRVVQFGGGGFDGFLITGLTLYRDQVPSSPTALKQGYVTLGSDGGHKSPPSLEAFSFGLDDEALTNYGKQSVKKAHDAAMVVIRKAYGRSPERFYFIGGSQGGHEALDAAARYPKDYDGVVAHYPAYNVTMLHLASLNVGRTLYAKDGAAWINPKKTKLISDAVYAKCDALDGVTDGIISNVGGCNAAFDPAVLRCPSGADTGDNCLSDPQMEAVRVISSSYKPGVTIAGMDTFPKLALLEGAPFRGPSNFGQLPKPANELSLQNAVAYLYGAVTVKYIITRDPQQDPMTFDPLKWKDRLATLGGIMDVTDVSLEKFRAKGGKILLTHGTADDSITPHNSIEYYKRQLARFGQEKLNGFLRFYLIPGFGHGSGSGGPFDAKFDALVVLEKWVERGQAPSGLVAIDGNQGANRARPLCEYPTWPKFTGAPGTENSAASFTCSKE